MIYLKIYLNILEFGFKILVATIKSFSIDDTLECKCTKFHGHIMVGDPDMKEAIMPPPPHPYREKRGEWGGGWVVTPSILKLQSKQENTEIFGNMEIQVELRLK